jgi:hypothetical protein
LKALALLNLPPCPLLALASLNFRLDGIAEKIRPLFIDL